VHRLSLAECLRWIAHTYPEMARVRYRFWGIEPATLDVGPELSAPVSAAVLAVAAEIRHEVERPVAS
jgi:hypothetical protein